MRRVCLWSYNRRLPSLLPAASSIRCTQRWLVAKKSSRKVCPSTTTSTSSFSSSSLASFACGFEAFELLTLSNFNIKNCYFDEKSNRTFQLLAHSMYEGSQRYIHRRSAAAQMLAMLLLLGTIAIILSLLSNCYCTEGNRGFSTIWLSRRRSCNSKVVLSTLTSSIHLVGVIGQKSIYCLRTMSLDRRKKN